jgi:hypothetical protein
MTAQSMMRVKFKRPSGFRTMATRTRDELKTLIANRLVIGLTDIQNSILETPVYTGNTLVNYRWSLGSPETTTRSPVKDPPRPGKTSELPRGSEPRRQANASVIQQEFLELLASVRQNPFQHIFLNNNVAYFSDVEYGTYASEGHTSRTPPGGMTRRGETLLEYSMMGYIKRVA